MKKKKPVYYSGMRLVGDCSWMVVVVIDIPVKWECPSEWSPPAPPSHSASLYIHVPPNLSLLDLLNNALCGDAKRARGPWDGISSGFSGVH